MIDNRGSAPGRPPGRHLRPARALLTVALLLAGCGRESGSGRSPNEQGAGAPPLSVFVTIPPQEYLVRRVGDAHVSVESLVGPGQSPHTFEPTPRQVVALSAARLYFTIGLPFERVLVEKLAGSGPQIVDMQQGIRLRRLTEEEATAGWLETAQAAPSGHPEGGDAPGSDPHAHEHKHAHAAGEPDVHTWLDPRLLQQQARTVCEALKRLAPQQAGDFERNLAALERELSALHEQIARRLAPYRGREFFVFHPAYGYFADAYGLRQVAIEVGGREAGPRGLAAIIERARAAGAKVVFYQPQHSRTGADTVAREIGAEVVPLDAQAYDCIANLRDIAGKLEQALRRAEAQDRGQP